MKMKVIFSVSKANDLAKMGFVIKEVKYNKIHQGVKFLFEDTKELNDAMCKLHLNEEKKTDEKARKSECVNRKQLFKHE